MPGFVPEDSIWKDTGWPCRLGQTLPPGMDTFEKRKRERRSMRDRYTYIRRIGRLLCMRCNARMRVFWLCFVVLLVWLWEDMSMAEERLVVHILDVVEMLCFERCCAMTCKNCSWAVTLMMLESDLDAVSIFLFPTVASLGRAKKACWSILKWRVHRSTIL